MRQGIELEKIEEYILGRLSPKENVLIEETMEMDPLLKSEISVQKEIISSLQATRKAELKARLNSIKVPAASWWTAPKIAASLLLLLSATGILYYSTLKKPADSAVSVVTPSPELIKTKTAPPAELKVESEKPSASEVPQKKEIKNQEITVANPTNTMEMAKETTDKTEIVIPSFDEDFEQMADLDKNVALPESGLNSYIDGRNKTIEVEILEDKGRFNYQYFNNKLFLHGDFNNIQYEVLELNTHKGKQVFLYFNELYFSIVPNTFDITPLKPLLDTEIKNQLDTLRIK